MEQFILKQKKKIVPLTKSINLLDMTPKSNGNKTIHNRWIQRKLLPTEANLSKKRKTPWIKVFLGNYHRSQGFELYYLNWYTRFWILCFLRTTFRSLKWILISEDNKNKGKRRWQSPIHYQTEMRLIASASR